MLNNSANRNRHSRRKWFILLPTVFLLVGYLLLFVCLTPIFDPLVSVYQLAFSSVAPPTADEPEASSIFSGTTGQMYGTLQASEVDFPSYGDAFGHITVEGTEIDAPVFYGDSDDLLRKGACMSMYSRIPGCGSGTMLSAHNNRHFHTLPDAKIGAEVRLETTYGVYIYKVYETKVLHKDDETYRRKLNAGKDELILYTCYPVDTIASTPQRYFAFCEYVAGPHVNLYEE